MLHSAASTGRCCGSEGSSRHGGGSRATLRHGLAPERPAGLLRAVLLLDQVFVHGDADTQHRYSGSAAEQLKILGSLFLLKSALLSCKDVFSTRVVKRRHIAVSLVSC